MSPGFPCPTRFLMPSIKEMAVSDVPFGNGYSATRSPALQRFLYGNAGFSKLHAIESLNDELWRFDVRLFFFFFE